MSREIREFLATLDPYSALPDEVLDGLSSRVRETTCAEGAQVYTIGERLEGVFIVVAGEIAIHDGHDSHVSTLGRGNSFGERGLGRDGLAATTATATRETELLLLPADDYHRLVAAHQSVRRFFDRGGGARQAPEGLATLRVDSLMSRRLVTCTPQSTAREAARSMASARVSSVCVTDDGRLTGILTLRDVATRIVAEGLAPDTPVADLMTRDPITLGPASLGSDVLHAMMEARIGHLPITDGNRLVGIVTQTDLTRHQALTSGELVADIAKAETTDQIAHVTSRIPDLLAQLVAAGHRHDTTTRLITDIADAATRRLLAMAEAELGPPPCRYLWLACGSQGRQEQTGLSDQDNCLILDDDAGVDAEAYFDRLATIVCDGLDASGYVYCPGDMMATNPRWRQPLATWRGYFRQWIARPSPEARMLASVMFDLRPIGGDRSLFADLQATTLAAARANTIFVSHMIANALTHTPPLGLIRNFALIRAGEHRNTIDIKLSGVVPIIDLARILAIRGELAPVNTRARIAAARAAGVVSDRGGQDLLDAYDLIAQTRLDQQFRQVRQGAAPSNFVAPSSLSHFDRAHLRDAFVVVKGMQSAVGHGRGAIG